VEHAAGEVDASGEGVVRETADATVADLDLAGDDWRVARAADRRVEIDNAAVPRRLLERALQRLEEDVRRLDVHRAVAILAPRARYIDRHTARGRLHRLAEHRQERRLPARGGGRSGEVAGWNRDIVRPGHRQRIDAEGGQMADAGVAGQAQSGPRPGQPPLRVDEACDVLPDERLELRQIPPGDVVLE